MAKILKVEQNLDQLAEVRAELAQLEEVYNVAIATYTQDRDNNPAIKDLRAQAASLEEAVQAQAIKTGHTFAGSTLQVVYYPPTPKLVPGAIKIVAEKLPELVSYNGERATVTAIAKSTRK